MRDEHPPPAILLDTTCALLLTSFSPVGAPLASPIVVVESLAVLQPAFLHYIRLVSTLSSVPPSPVLT